MTDCGSVPCIFNVISGPSLWIIIAISVVVGGFAALYRYREVLRGKPAYVYIGVVSVILLVGVIGTVFLISEDRPEGLKPVGWSAGASIDQNPGVVEIAIVDTGGFDSIGIVGPDGTRSTTAAFEAGTRFTLRSNEKVINYLNAPENNITVLTMSGTKTVESVSELPSEYQKAPDGLINPEADISNYDNASVATVACLVTLGYPGIEAGERHVPANVTLPCNTPVLAQTDLVTSGTSVEPTGPSVIKTLTSPVTLSDGEYTIVGAEDGDESVFHLFTIEDEVLPEQDETESPQPANNSTARSVRDG